MSGWVQGLAPCGRCRRPFGFNPHKVPSLRMSDGTQLVFCRDCIEAVNPLRVKQGLDPIVPLPGAYDPIPENGL